MLRQVVRKSVLSSRAAGSSTSRVFSRHYVSEKNYEVFKEDFLANLRRKGLLLKGIMTTKKFFAFRVPTSATVIRYPFTFSDLAGHGSFLFLALSYLESDFLNLRLYALSGISLSIIFQYYREKPLWIPIRWNSLFFLINSIMIFLLLKQRTDAENLPDEQKQLYTKVFQAKGMSPVEFLKLISIAKRLDAKKGDKLVDEQKTNTRLYLVVKGNLTVLKSDQKVGTIKDNQFVGAMSFLNWQSRLTEDLLQQKKEQEEMGWSTPWEEHIASVFSLTSKKKVHELLREATASNQEEVTVEKLAQPAVSMAPVTVNNSKIIVTETSDDSKAEELKAAFEEPSDSLLVLSPDDATKLSSKNQSSKSSVLEDGHLASADAVCDEDCVVYYWKFKDLRLLIEEYPLLGLVFERCISDDLNQKMTSTWDEELKIRYKQLLIGAVMDDEVNDKARRMLYEFRETYQISEDDHVKMLAELQWTEEEFNSGYKG